MPRHPRFEEHRWLGDKRNFTVYDCDDDRQFESMKEIPLESVASFAPDELREARNRGFRPFVGTDRGVAAPAD